MHLAGLAQLVSDRSFPKPTRLSNFSRKLDPILHEYFQAICLAALSQTSECLKPSDW